MAPPFKFLTLCQGENLCELTLSETKGVLPGDGSQFKTWIGEQETLLSINIHGCSVLHTARRNLIFQDLALISFSLLRLELLYQATVQQLSLLHNDWGLVTSTIIKQSEQRPIAQNRLRGEELFFVR